MNEHDQDRRIHPGGRSIAARAFGNNPEELEFAALDEARKFFGEDLRLEVVRRYKVMRPVVPQHKQEAERLEKTYTASIDVRVVE